MVETWPDYLTRVQAQAKFDKLKWLRDAVQTRLQEYEPVGPPEYDMVLQGLEEELDAFDFALWALERVLAAWPG